MVRTILKTNILVAEFNCVKSHISVGGMTPIFCLLLVFDNDTNQGFQMTQNGQYYHQRLFYVKSEKNH